eukprot:3812325-Rhodomonas_salina.1
MEYQARRQIQVLAPHAELVPRSWPRVRGSECAHVHAVTVPRARGPRDLALSGTGTGSFSGPGLEAFKFRGSGGPGAAGGLLAVGH